MRRIFEREYPSLVRFLYRRLGDRDLAEDLAQDAFVRLLDQQPRNPRAWLFTVALNLARDTIRGETRRASHLRLLANESEGMRMASPEEATLRKEATQVVRAALDALPERDRILLLLWEERLSYRQIAEAIGVAPSSIGPLLARAQRRFLESYDRPNEEGDDAITSGGR